MADNVTCAFVVDEGCPAAPEYNVSTMMCPLTCGLCSPSSGEDAAWVPGVIAGVVSTSAVALAVAVYVRRRKYLCPKRGERLDFFDSVA